MKILIFGGGGMLGHKLVQILQKDFEVWTTVKNTFELYKPFGIFDSARVIVNVDVLDNALLKKIIRNVDPDVVINAVGIIKQLPSSNNVVGTLLINSIFPHHLSEICAEENRYLISISTDCVFDGSRGNYTEDDISNAADLYGKSKNLGEVINNRCVTFRTSIIGRELFTKHSLVEWFLSNEGKKIKGFVNAVYTGFPTVVLAGIISDLLKKEIFLEGLYHVSSEPINKFNLLKMLRSAYKLNVEIEPFEDFKIDRSLNSDKFRLQTNFNPKSWQEMVAIMVKDKFPYQNR